MLIFFWFLTSIFFNPSYTWASSKHLSQSLNSKENTDPFYISQSLGRELKQLSAFHEKKDFANIQTMATRLLKQNLGSKYLPYILQYLIEAYQSQNHFQEIITTLESFEKDFLNQSVLSVSEANPFSFEWALMLAESHFQTSNYSLSKTIVFRLLEHINTQNFDPFDEKQRKIFLRCYKILLSVMQKTDDPEFSSTYEFVWANFPDADFFAEIQFKGVFQPKPDSVIKRAYIFLDLMQNQKALDLFSDMNIEKWDQKSRCHKQFIIGKVYRRTRNFSQAKQVLSEMIVSCKTHEKIPDALFLLAKVYSFSQDPLQRETGVSYYQRLAQNFPDNSLADDALFWAGDILERNQKYDSALAHYMIEISLFPEADFTPESYWRLAWIQYKRQKYDEALSWFDIIIHSHHKTVWFSSQETSRALFWKSRILELRENKEGAKQARKELLERFPSQFYSFYTWFYLRSEKEYTNIFMSYYHASPSFSDLKDYHSLSDSFESMKTIRKLIEKDIIIPARKAVNSINAHSLSDSKALQELAMYHCLTHNYYESSWMLRKKIPLFLDDPPSLQNVSWWKCSYPMVYKDIVYRQAKANTLDPFLILGLMREESALKENIISWAGAIGLMQLMPTTAKEQSEKMKLPFDINRLIEPDYNITLGSAYLKRISEILSDLKFPDYILAVGAYNGGPGNMKQWVQQSETVSLDEFIEEIPYEESRNYVKRVLSSYFTYKILYDYKKVLSIFREKQPAGFKP